MIALDICTAANHAADRCTEARHEMSLTADDPPSPDNYLTAMHYVQALRTYADALERWTEAMKKEYL